MQKVPAAVHSNKGIAIFERNILLSVKNEKNQF